MGGWWRTGSVCWLSRFFFFSSRRRHTRLQGDWSSDVCSSDLGDRVQIYMPMIAEAAFAMLACARLGAIHSVVFGGFASAALASRIDDAEPKVDRKSVV